MASSNFVLLSPLSRQDRSISVLVTFPLRDSRHRCSTVMAIAIRIRGVLSRNIRENCLRGGIICPHKRRRRFDEKIFTLKDLIPQARYRSSAAIEGCAIIKSKQMGVTFNRVIPDVSMCSNLISTPLMFSHTRTHKGLGGAHTRQKCRLAWASAARKVCIGGRAKSSRVSRSVN